MLPKDKMLNPAKVYKERKKHDRFNGMPEEEVSKRTLPDHLTNNLDIVIVSAIPFRCYSYNSSNHTETIIALYLLHRLFEKQIIIRYFLTLTGRYLNTYTLL